MTLLDVAGGTGDIAFRLRESIAASHVRSARPPQIIVCDINPRMLAVGKERAAARGFVTGACAGGQSGRRPCRLGGSRRAPSD